MKAAIIEGYQAPIEIGTVATPRLEDDSVLLAVHAAGINPIDDILRSGDMKDRMPLSFPHVMGYDVSGMVVDGSGFRARERRSAFRVERFRARVAGVILPTVSPPS